MTPAKIPAKILTPAKISVVIPAINEVEKIRAAVESAKRAGAGEIIVADGGSHDRTIEVATRAGASKIVRSLPGRGIQLNSGALLVDKDQEVILFLHADNSLHERCLQQICDSHQAVWGAFRQRIDSKRMIFGWIEWGNAMRVRMRRVPFWGSSDLRARRDFDQSRGFDEIPLMEDVAFSKRMRKVARPALLEGPILVSARRWEQRPIRQTLRNWSIQTAYALGISPQRLKHWYR